MSGLTNDLPDIAPLIMRALSGFTTPLIKVLLAQAQAFVACDVTIAAVASVVNGLIFLYSAIFYMVLNEGDHNSRARHGAREADGEQKLVCCVLPVKYQKY